jgi:hypothetical protein
MYDNRTLTIESHITKGAINNQEKDNYYKPLQDKGWVEE